MRHGRIHEVAENASDQPDLKNVAKMNAPFSPYQKLLSVLNLITRGIRNLHMKISPTQFTLAMALTNTVLYHLPLFSWAVTTLHYSSFNGMLTLATLFIAPFLLTAAILFLFFALVPQVVKPFCMLIVLGNAVALFFLSTYHVILDKTMMGNVRTTDFLEVSEFLHPTLFLYLLVLGVLPCGLMMRIKIQGGIRLRLLQQAFATVLICVSWGYLSSSTWLWIDQNSKRIGGLILPWAYVINAARSYAETSIGPQKQILLPPATFAKDEKIVVVLVIGEAARAQNFSLYGYHGSTNPKLSETGVAALKNTVSCATYTTASVRCILSHTDPASLFSGSYEPLPSYLQRQGVDVIWRTNNWGEPDLKVQSYQRAETLREGCTGSGCDYDEVLLTGLLERITSSKRKKIFVVLHQKGSHGPSYYTRYPDSFEQFKPVCKSVELNQCTNAELVNAYDNTILYTDHFLNRIIQMLKGFADRPTLMIYISDHGESLGEYGLYLHGTPYSIAPDVQKDIPFIVWMSNSFMNQSGVSITRLRQQDKHAHSNIFHSIMGAFGMRSDVYNNQLDIFSSQE